MRPRVALALDRLRAGRALRGVGRLLGALDAAEVRDQRLPRPAVAGGIRPVVVVGGEPPDPHHRVQRRRAAERLAARPEDRPVLEGGLRDGVVVPVVLAAEELRERRRHVQFERLVGRARFEQQHRDGGILREPRSEGGAGRACPDDDVVGGQVAGRAGARTRHARNACTRVPAMRARLPSMRKRVNPSLTVAPCASRRTTAAWAGPIPSTGSWCG